MKVQLPESAEVLLTLARNRGSVRLLMVIAGGILLSVVLHVVARMTEGSVKEWLMVGALLTIFISFIVTLAIYPLRNNDRYARFVLRWFGEGDDDLDEFDNPCWPIAKEELFGMFRSWIRHSDLTASALPPEGIWKQIYRGALDGRFHESAQEFFYTLKTPSDQGVFQRVYDGCDEDSLHEAERMTGATKLIDTI